MYQPTVTSEINLILGISESKIIFWSRIYFYFFNVMHPCLVISERSQGSKEADLNHPTNRSRLLTNQKQLFSHMTCSALLVQSRSCDWQAVLLLVNETLYLILLDDQWLKHFEYGSTRMHQIEKIKVDSWSENYSWFRDTQDQFISDVTAGWYGLMDIFLIQKSILISSEQNHSLFPCSYRFMIMICVLVNG